MRSRVKISTQDDEEVKGMSAQAASQPVEETKVPVAAP